MQSNLFEHEKVQDASLHPIAGAPRGLAIDVAALSKSYGQRPVLQEVDLHIAAGEFVAVVGRSGCGKSTLLRLISGLEQAEAGSLIFGQDPQTKPDIRIMFQDARLLPWKRVLDNVALGLNGGTEQAAHALQQVGLGERAGEWPAVLSGGQRQRVALARALVHEPQVLLLDEPLGALDALTRIEMQQMIEALWEARKFTAVLVTHDVQEAIALADRVVLIEEGRITMDERIALARPRQRGSALFARYEESILARVLKTAPASADSSGDALAESRSALQVAWAI